MVQHEQDRRVRRTRRQLQQALVTLMREKELREITVRELTELADVNRGTFYAHYKDLEDMLEQVEHELFQQLSQVLEAHTPEEMQGNLSPILRDVFSFVWENRELCLTMIGHQQGEPFFQELRRLIYGKYLREWNGLYDLGSAGRTRPNYCLEFVVSGALGLVRAWVEGDMAEGPEEMAGLAEQLIVNGLPARKDPNWKEKGPFWT